MAAKLTRNAARTIQISDMVHPVKFSVRLSEENTKRKTQQFDLQ